MTFNNDNVVESKIGPYPLNRIVLCSADASPKAQRNIPSPAGFFFPRGVWVGALRNNAESIGCRFVILTTGHGLVNPDDLITPYDRHIDEFREEVHSIWNQTVPKLLRHCRFELMVFYSGGCPMDSYVTLLKRILHNLGISLLTFGKPNMNDIDKTHDLVQLSNNGASFKTIGSILKHPDRLRFYSAPTQSSCIEIFQAPVQETELIDSCIISEDKMTYTHFQHRHNFAVWCAARAVQRNSANSRILQETIEISGVVEFVKNNLARGLSQHEFDKYHENWCKTIMEFWDKRGIRGRSYGRAAKLLAIYLKSMIVVQDNPTALADVVHPPIDRIILQNISKDKDINHSHKQEWKNIKWTQLDGPSYKQLIADFRQVFKGKPFWFIEKYWVLTDD